MIRRLPSPPGAERWVAVDKPAGTIVHGAGGLLDELREAFGSEATPVHRLDRIATGVLLVARDAEALRQAHAAWPTDIEKLYVVRTRGVPSPLAGVIEAPLLEHRSGRPELLRRALRAAYGPSRAGQLLAGRRVMSIPPPPARGRTAAHPAGRPARTEYTVREEAGASALVEVRPRQGRMHQVRVHLASIGTPILGDPLYDSEPSGEPPLLHALRLVWNRPPGMPEGTVWRWDAPL